MIIISFFKCLCKGYLTNIFHYFMSLIITEAQLMKKMSRIPSHSLLLCLFGLLGGIINGLLGAGSGILLAYALRLASPALRKDSRDLLANATAIILPLSLISFLSYLRADALPPVNDLGVYLIPGIIGGLLGALLLGRLPELAIRRLFGSVVLVSGLIMLLR